MNNSSLDRYLDQVDRMLTQAEEILTRAETASVIDRALILLQIDEVLCTNEQRLGLLNGRTDVVDGVRVATTLARLRDLRACVGRARGDVS